MIRLMSLHVQNLFRSGRLLIGKDLNLFVTLRADGKGLVVIGDGVSIGYSLAPRVGNGEVLIQARSKVAVIEIASDVAISNNVSIIANQRITVGKECLIGDLVFITDSDFHAVDPLQRRISTGVIMPVIIGNNVWIGSRAIIQKGVTIGANSIVASMSVVTHNVPPDCIVGGNPAKFIRSISENE